MGEKKQFLCRIPNNLCDCSSLKEVELTYVWAAHSDFPLKRTVWSGASNLTLECRNLLISAR